MEYLIKLDYDPTNPIPLQEHEGFKKYLKVEFSFMASTAYVTDPYACNYRTKALQLIFKNSRCENFDPVVPYLAMNYFDRCIFSKNSVPELTRDRQHDVELLALCCLALSWKIRDRTFRISKLQERQPDFKAVEPEQFAKIEIFILKELDWKMRPVTAFCFLRHFASMYFKETCGFRRRAINEIIVQAQDDIVIARCKPSVIAISALLAASDFLYTDKSLHFLRKVKSTPIFLMYGSRIETCMTNMVGLCYDLKLVTESGAPWNGRKRVRAGMKSAESYSGKGKEKEPETMGGPITVEESKGSSFNFRLRWRIETSDEENDLGREALREKRKGRICKCM